MVNNGVLYPSTRGALEVDSSVYLEMPRAETVRNVELAPMIHRSPPQQLMPAHLKWGMGASLTLATLLVAGVKFYFDHQVCIWNTCRCDNSNSDDWFPMDDLQIVYEKGTGMEVVVLCALLVVFLLGSCTISLCRARTVPPMPIIAVPPVTPPTQSQVMIYFAWYINWNDNSILRWWFQQDSNEDLALGTILSLQVAQPTGPPSPEPPPPPYHIAVLLPQRNSVNSEAPPPTYEKAIS